MTANGDVAAMTSVAPSWRPWRGHLRWNVRGSPCWRLCAAICRLVAGTRF